MKSSDMLERPILEYLSRHNDPENIPFSERKFLPATWFNHEEGELERYIGKMFLPNVRAVFPPNIPDKLILSKMRKMILKGLVDGCACGCRGDFRITKKGEKTLLEMNNKVDT